MARSRSAVQMRGRVDALRLVPGARHVEGLAVLEDRPAAVLGAHRRGCLVETLLQRRAARHAALHRLVEVAQEVAGERDALGHGVDADQRVAAARHQRIGLDASRRASVPGQSVKCASPQ